MRTLLLAAAVLMGCAVSAAAAGYDASAWPMSGGGPARASSTTALGSNAPKIAWKLNTGAAVSRSSSVALGSDGTIYVGGHENLFALNPDGTIKWTSVNTAPTEGFGDPAVGGNSLVYVSSREAILAYSTAGSGAVAFVSSAAVRTAAGQSGGSGAVIVGPTGIVYVSHGDETIRPTASPNVVNQFAFLADLSTVAIQIPSFNVSATPGNQRSAIAISSDGVFGCHLRNFSNSSSLSCFNTGTGAAATMTMPDRFNTPQYNGLSFRKDGSFVTAFENTNNVCPSQPAGFIGMGAYTIGGLNVWRNCDIDINFPIRFHAPVSSGPSTTFVYVQNTAKIYALDNSTGGVRWSYSPASSGFTVSANQVSPLTLANGSNLFFTYCANGAASLRAASLNPNTGGLNWDVPVSSVACNSPQPIPGPGGRLYLNNGPEVIALETSSAVSIAASTAAASASEVAGTGFWYSTVTVSPALAGGIPVSSGVIVELSHFATTPGSVASSIAPSATSFLQTDTAGQVKFVVNHQFPAGYTADKLAGQVSTAIFNVAGVAPQSVFITESRVATVGVATQTAALGGAGGAVRFSTMTFTVRDAASAPLSGVPCISRAPVTSYPGSASMTAYPSQVFWTTNGSGQASVVFGDNLAGLNNDNYAVYAVTHTVACLGTATQQVVMKEQRVASVQISTGQASFLVSGGNYARVSTVTVTVRDAGSAAVPGVPLALDYTSAAPLTIVPSAVGFTTATNASGQASFVVYEYLQGVSPSLWATMASTMTLRVLSFPDQIFALREERIGSVTLSSSTPVMSGSSRIVIATVTVLDAGGSPLPSIPVAIENVTFGAVTTYQPNVATSVGIAQTNALGVATFTITQDLLSSLYAGFYNFGQFENFSAAHTINALQRPAQTLNTREVRASTFTVSFSSTVIDSGLRYATMTVTVRDSSNNPVPNVPVAVSSYTLATNGASNLMAMDPPLGGVGQFAGAATDASGQARFTIKLGSTLSSYDSFNDFVASVTFVPLNVTASTFPFLVENNRLSSYQVAVPTYPVSVGVAFVSTITALNSYGHQLSSYTENGINLVPLFAGTAVQGTGTLGTNVTGAFTAGRFVIAAQTYNKVEYIDIKASRSSDGKNGTSNSLTIQGPHHFIVTVPTSAQAGVPFSMTVRAVDASSVQVVGYAATLSLSAYKSSNLALSGAGVLGVTNVNMPANGVVTIANQTYTKAEGIQIRASDTGASVVGQSTSSVVVGAGTPASITLLANPQSTIAGVPSVLTATIYDGYSNPVSNSTATFSVATGSGVVSLSLVNGSVVSAVTSTQAVTDAFGQTQAFFSSTNSLSAQADLLRASIGALARDTTVYSTVLVTSAGGAVVNFGNPLLRADIPANTYGFSVRLGIQGKAELAAADLALTTAAFAATANTFVSTTVLKLTAVRDASPTTSAGAGSKLVTVSLPYTVTSGSISVGAYGAQSVLVPLSVMRVFKLNRTSSVFEQVIDGVTAVNSVTGVVSAEVSDPEGIYALGAPSFTNLTTGSSATVTTALAGGATAEVVVPPGGFSAPATISVTVPGASAVPALPARPGLTALGVTISVSAGGLQPSLPVTIKIGYTPANVAGVNPDHLRLARYDASTGWVVLDSSADTAARQVVGTTNHFSLFQIVAQAPGASVADGFVFPNPFRPSAGHTNIKLSNLPAGAHVKVFTATGRLLKELDADAAGQILSWNGADRDGRALPSGVYLAVVEGAGGRRTIKFAVQR